jgi:hypothetical protein
VNLNLTTELMTIAIQTIKSFDEDESGKGDGHLAHALMSEKIKEYENLIGSIEHKSAKSRGNEKRKSLSAMVKRKRKAPEFKVTPYKIVNNSSKAIVIKRR